MPATSSWRPTSAMHARHAAQQRGRPPPRRRRPHRCPAPAADGARRARRGSRRPSGTGAVDGRLWMAMIPHMAARLHVGHRQIRQAPSRRREHVTTRSGRAPRRRAARRPARASSSVAASTITRTSGSVPLARSSTRPSPPSSASAAAISSASSSAIVGWRSRDPDVHEHLRIGGHHGVGEFGERPSPTLHALQQPQPGQQPVAGRGEVAVDDVPALLAADGVVARVQRLEHVAVADGRRRRP